MLPPACPGAPLNWRGSGSSWQPPCWRAARRHLLQGALCVDHSPCWKDGDPSTGTDWTPDGGGVPRLNLLCFSVSGFLVGEAHPPETDDVGSGGHIASGSLRTGARLLIKLIHMAFPEPLSPRPLPLAGRDSAAPPRSSMGKNKPRVRPCGSSECLFYNHQPRWSVREGDAAASALQRCPARGRRPCEGMSSPSWGASREQAAVGGWGSESATWQAFLGARPARRHGVWTHPCPL